MSDENVGWDEEGNPYPLTSPDPEQVAESHAAAEFDAAQRARGFGFIVCRRMPGEVPF
jgi:hypothetical protein